MHSASINNEILDNLDKPLSDKLSELGWTPIPGYEMRYLAHKEGAVAYDPRSWKGEEEGKISFIPTRLSDSGYHRVRLTDDAGNRITWLLHHIIYRTFNGELPPRGGRKSEDINHPLWGMVVMHGDDMRDHNEASNLTLGTHKENRKMIGRARKFRDMSDEELRAHG